MHLNPEELVQDGLLDVEGAAHFLGIRRSKLYALMEAGQIPYCKLGRARRIPKRALVEFAAANLKGGWARPRGGDEA